MRQVALHVHLPLLPRGRRREGDDPEPPGPHTLGDRLDGAALPGPISALEDDAHLEALGLDPLLQLDQLDMQPPQLAIVFLPLELLFPAPVFPIRAGLVLLGLGARFLGDGFGFHQQCSLAHVQTPSATGLTSSAARVGHGPENVGNRESAAGSLSGIVILLPSRSAEYRGDMISTPAALKASWMFSFKWA